jgi:hypothetical protein
MQLVKIKQLRMSKKSLACRVGLHPWSHEKHGVRYCTKCGALKMQFDELIDVCP